MLQPVLQNPWVRGVGALLILLAIIVWGYLLRQALIPLFLALMVVASVADLIKAFLDGDSFFGRSAAKPVPRDDGSWLVDGALLLDRLKETLQIQELPGKKSGDFDTVAGYALFNFCHIPVAGESFQVPGWHFEVVEMNKRRIDKLLISPDDAES